MQRGRHLKHSRFPLTNTGSFYEIRLIPYIAQLSSVYRGSLKRLLKLLKSHHTNLAIQLYQKLIDWTVLPRKREDYQKVGEYLTQLREVYQHLNREGQWAVYLAEFQKQHSHKRLLLGIIAKCMS